MCLGRSAPWTPDRIKARLLQTIAADFGRFYQTPDAGRLAGIYRLIAEALRGCPG